MIPIERSEKLEDLLIINKQGSGHHWRKKEFGRRCFSYGALDWNNLPNVDKIAESVSSFKSILKRTII